MSEREHWRLAGDYQRWQPYLHVRDRRDVLVGTAGEVVVYGGGRPSDAVLFCAVVGRIDTSLRGHVAELPPYGENSRTFRVLVYDPGWGPA